MTHAKPRTPKRAKPASDTLTPADVGVPPLGAPSLGASSLGVPLLGGVQGLVLHQAQDVVSHQAQGGVGKELLERAIQEAKAHPERVRSVQTQIMLHANAEKFPAEIRAVLPAPEVTREGFRRVWGVASRGNCIYHYSSIQGSVHVFRPGDVVFGQTFCRSFLGLPFTLWHPKSGAQPANAREVTHGSIFEVTPFPELGIVRMGVVLYTPEVMEAFDSGMTALSTGEWNHILSIAGELEGEPYDGILYEATGNHLALVDIGAAGPLAHLRSNAESAPDAADGSNVAGGSKAEPVTAEALGERGLGFILPPPGTSNSNASNNSPSNHNASPGSGASPSDVQPGKVAPPPPPVKHEGQGDSPMMKKIKFKMMDGTECEVEVPEESADQILSAIAQRDDKMGVMQAEIDGLKALSAETDKADDKAGQEQAAMTAAVKHTAEAVAQIVALQGGKASIQGADGKPVALSSFATAEEMQRAFLIARFPKEGEVITKYGPAEIKVRLDLLQQHAERASAQQAKLETHSGKARDTAAADEKDAVQAHAERVKQLNEARAAKKA